MSRNQFLTDANSFLEEIRPNTAKSTFKDISRKLRLIARIAYDLYQKDRVSSNNARRMTPEDINAYVGYRRECGIADSTIRKDISLLRRFFKWLGNNAIERYEVIYGNQKPKAYDGKKPPMDNDVIERVYELARKTEDWTTMEGCTAVVLSTACGLRPQESRQMLVEDVILDKENSMVYVRHPKGEGTYGKNRFAPVMDGAEDILGKYLRMRSQKVEQFGCESKALFPKLRPGMGGSEFISQQAFNRFKSDVEVAVDAKFEIRSGRRAFGQRALDAGYDLSTLTSTEAHLLKF